MRAIRSRNSSFLKLFAAIPSSMHRLLYRSRFASTVASSSSNRAYHGGEGMSAPSCWKALHRNTDRASDGRSRVAPQSNRNMHGPELLGAQAGLDVLVAVARINPYPNARLFALSQKSGVQVVPLGRF